MVHGLSVQAVKTWPQKIKMEDTGRVKFHLVIPQASCIWASFIGQAPYQKDDRANQRVRPPEKTIGRMVNSSLVSRYVGNAAFKRKLSRLLGHWQQNRTDRQDSLVKKTLTLIELMPLGEHTCWSVRPPTRRRRRTVIGRYIKINNNRHLGRST